MPGKIKSNSARFILIMTAFVMAFGGNYATAYAHTENDLREAAGLGAYTKKSIQVKIDKTAARLAREKDFNSVIEAVKGNGLSTALNEETVTKEKTSYKKLLDDFRSGKEAGDIITDFSDYNSYTDIDDDDMLYGDTALPEEADTSGLESRIRRLKVLRKIASDKTDIGKVGNRFPGVTEERQPMLSGVGKSAVRIRTRKGEKIYSAFSGFILDTEGKTVTEKAGVTLNCKYEGIKSAVYKGEKVGQRQLIGTAAGRSIRVTVTENTSPVNMLLFSGDRGADIYEGYLSENPWNKQILDFSDVKGKVKDSSIKRKKKGSFVTVYKGGQKTEGKDDVPEKSKNRRIYTGDPFSHKTGDDPVTSKRAVER